MASDGYISKCSVPSNSNLHFWFLTFGHCGAQGWEDLWIIKCGFKFCSWSDLIGHCCGFMLPYQLKKFKQSLFGSENYHLWLSTSCVATFQRTLSSCSTMTQVPPAAPLLGLCHRLQLWIVLWIWLLLMLRCQCWSQVRHMSTWTFVHTTWSWSHTVCLRQLSTGLTPDVMSSQPVDWTAVTSESSLSRLHSSNLDISQLILVLGQSDSCQPFHIIIIIINNIQTFTLRHLRAVETRRTVHYSAKSDLKCKKARSKRVFSVAS